MRMKNERTYYKRREVDGIYVFDDINGGWGTVYYPHRGNGMPLAWHITEMSGALKLTLEQALVIVPTLDRLAEPTIPGEIPSWMKGSWIRPDTQAE